MRKRLLMFLLFAVLCFSTTAWAAPFPPKTDEVVQDAEGYLDQEQTEDFTQFVQQFSDTYKVVVVEGIKPEAESVDEYAQKLYDNYNLGDNAMMIVLDINSQELGVYPGPALQEKGAKLVMLHEKIVTFYKPFSNQNEYMKGIKTFVAEVNNELERLSAKQQAAGGEETQDAPAEAAGQPEADSLWNVFPWWAYALAALFLLFLIGLLYAFVRRNNILAEVDRVEDWKDELVEKIQLVELDKPLRRATGATEEWYAQLADRKENLLRMRIPDVEMIILEAEEACDRFRFQAARNLLAEGEEMLTQLEGELAQLKADSRQVAEKKQENSIAIPEIGKLAEQCERKLTNARLDYGLTFHEWKAKLDEVEGMRQTVKELLAGGDTVQAHELTMQAQESLKEVLTSLERLPELAKRVQTEMVAELKQLEDDLSLVVKDGYELNKSQVDAALLQLKQLLISAETALEEGNLQHVEMHAKAFAIKLDETYQSIEEAVLSQRQAAAALTAEQAASASPERTDATADGEAADALGHSKLSDQEQRVPWPEQSQPGVQPEQAWQSDREQQADPAGDGDTAERVTAPLGEEGDEPGRPDEPQLTGEGPAAPLPELMAEAPLEQVAASRVRADWPDDGGSVSTTEDERRLLLSRDESGADKRESSARPVAANAHPVADDDTAAHETADVEYELVVPKRQEGAPEESAANAEQASFVRMIETEDDALDVMEHISNALLRIRQQIKRSYLPGVPDEVKFHFDQVVQVLARTKMSMERHGYDRHEVGELLLEAEEELRITEQLTEEAIATCQKAEGAIQYTNRYRRQNQQVHQMLSKAEQAFRQLRFTEALTIAEEARLLVEGEADEESASGGWLLRRKKKGAGW